MMIQALAEKPVKPKVLIVEDEGIIALDLEYQLGEINYQVCGNASTGEEAIAIAMAERPDIVLMDIILKGRIDGIETAKIISQRHNIPIIFLTSFNDPATVERAAAITPFGYVTKPYQINELRAVIEVALYKAQLEKKLQESEHWFTSMLRCVGDGIIATDASGRIRYINPVGEATLGLTLSGAIGKKYNDIVKLINFEENQQINSPLKNLYTAGVDEGTCLLDSGDKLTPIDYTVTPILGEHEESMGIVMAFRDVHERLATEESLRQSEEHFRHSFEFAPLGMALISLDGSVLRTNNALCELLARTHQELSALRIADLNYPDDSEHEQQHLEEVLEGQSRNVQFEKRYNLENGGFVWTLNSVSLLTDKGRPYCYLYQIHDLTERKEAENNLLYLANYDSLTGLANRANLRQEAERMLLQAKRQQNRVAILFLDLDHFKEVNDTLGHEAGDRLLRMVSSRLKDNIRETDFVARLGGDEFVVLLPGIQEPDEVGLIAEKIQGKFNEPLHLSGHDILIGASIGVSIYPDDAQDVTGLFSCADSALFQAKAEHRNRIEFYRPELTYRVEEKLKILAALRHAIARNELEMYFQPILSIKDKSTVSNEALIRWNHPSRGLLTPDHFIPVAEESGLIVPIGEWIIAESFHAMAKVNRDLGQGSSISVNISARQFKSENLVASIRQALSDSGLPAKMVCLEITEHLMLNDSRHNIDILKELKALGLKITLDDFGTGYSSLRYIKQFKPDMVKIDRTFITEIANDPDDAAIVHGILTMARNLGVKVVAEGVENKPQEDMLSEYGCDLVQGYYYSVPLRLADWNALLQARA